MMGNANTVNQACINDGNMVLDAKQEQMQQKSDVSGVAILLMSLVDVKSKLVLKQDI